MRNNSERDPLIESAGKTEDLDEMSKKEENIVLGISLKKDTSIWNLFAVAYVWFLMTSIGGYINVQIVYLLRDANYFDMNDDY